MSLTGALCAFTFFIGFDLGIRARADEVSSDVKHGMEMSSRAYDMVCLYETLLTFPKTSTSAFWKCSKLLKNNVEILLSPNENYIKEESHRIPAIFGHWAKDAFDGIPEAYKEKCIGLLEDSQATPDPAQVEKDALNDAGNGGGAYPFQAFAYCLLHTLRTTHGEKAINEVKEVALGGDISDWGKSIMHKRQNEYRKLHGADPLEILDDLNAAAQAWAEKDAAECTHHSREDWEKDISYQGKDTGQLKYSATLDDKNTLGLYVMDHFYEGIQFYPFPDGYKEDGANDMLYRQIHEFAQLVWKSTKQVGYGMAFNPECAKNGQKATGYVVVRYFPAGNQDNEYADNVMPATS